MIVGLVDRQSFLIIVNRDVFKNQLAVFAIQGELHGIHVDKDGNVWVADGRDKRSDDNPPDEVNGHQVHKFSPTGIHLMAISTPGGGRAPAYALKSPDW